MNTPARFPSWFHCLPRLAGGLLLLTVACPPAVQAQKQGKLPREVAPGIVQLAELPKGDFKECSGLVASRRFPGVLWTHNDGTDRRLFAIDRAGKKLAEFEVQGVFIWDFEDLAIDETNRLYVADIGNNAQVRPTVAIHQIAEPDPAKSGGALKPLRSWTLRFSGLPFDAETLVIWRGWGYLVSKTEKDIPARLYRWPLAGGASGTLEDLGRLEVKWPVTGGDVSPDGAKFGLVTTQGACVWEINGDPAKALGTAPFTVKFSKGQVEGCTFDADGLLAVAETRELFLYTAAPFVARPAGGN